jgi:hypothetical protein
MSEIDDWVEHENEEARRWGRSWQASLVRIALGLLFGLGFAAIAFWMLQHRLLFHPQPSLLWAANHDALNAHRWDVETPHGRIEAWKIPGRTSCVRVYYGGNAEEVSATALAWLSEHEGSSKQCQAVFWNYPGYGRSDGHAEVESVRRSADYLLTEIRRTQPGVELDLVGRSLGTGFAAERYNDEDVRSLALITPFDGIKALAGDLAPWLPRVLIHQELDLIGAIGTLEKPVLVLMAVGDEVIPNASTERLIAALQGEDRNPLLRWEPISQTSHDGILDDSRAKLALERWSATFGP